MKTMKYSLNNHAARANYLPNEEKYMKNKKTIELNF